MTPREFAQQEALDWLRLNRIDPYALPSWGRVFQDGPRSVLVWVDAVGRVRVLDVTGNPIVGRVNQAAFESPSGNSLDRLLLDINSVVDSVGNLLEVGVVLAVLVGAVVLLK